MSVSLLWRRGGHLTLCLTALCCRRDSTASGRSTATSDSSLLASSRAGSVNHRRAKGREVAQVMFRNGHVRQLQPDDWASQVLGQGAVRWKTLLSARVFLTLFRTHTQRAHGLRQMRGDTEHAWCRGDKQPNQSNV